MRNVFHAKLEAETVIRGELSMSTIKASSVQPYTGAYTITPSTYDTQILPTANRRAERNITIEPIPQWETGNTAGGKTLIIGEEFITNEVQ